MQHGLPILDIIVLFRMRAKAGMHPTKQGVSLELRQLSRCDGVLNTQTGAENLDHKNRFQACGGIKQWGFPGRCGPPWYGNRQVA